ncbi:LamG domain-containing protein, partial [bacterium]|nr:LamG domain-containing protein [Candidatus Elulimicrobium humile]
MSYQLKILKDHPIVYYPITETYVSLLQTYQDVIDNYDTYQEFEDDFLTYQSVLSNVIYDHSGCENHGVYQGDLTDVFLPLTSGGSHAANITNTNYITVPTTKDYYASTASGGFGNKYTSDNDFTIEAWIYTNIPTTNLTTIFADPTNNIGIFWQRGNIIFKLDSEILNYTVPYFKKALHVVAVYSVFEMTIYVDGEAVASKSLTNFAFTNTSLSLQIGPTAHATDSFIVDDPAVYRYALSANQILNHYNDNGYLPPIQIVSPENGQLFELYDNGVNTKYRYSYPEDKSWEYFLTEDLYYNKEDNAIEIAYSEDAVTKTVYITDL